MYACYIHALYYIHTVDQYMTVVFINVYLIMFNVYIAALAYFDGYARAATLIIDIVLALIIDRLRISLILITDSCY